MTSGDPRPTKNASPATLKTIAFLGYCVTLGGAWWILQLLWPGWPYHYFRIWLPLVAVPYWIALVVFVKHRYGVDVTARLTKAQRRALGPRRKRWGRPLRWIFGYVLTPVMLAIALFIGIVALPTYWDAAHGGGSVGQLTFTNKDCSGGCTWYGDFVSDDNKYDYSSVQMDDPVQDAAVGWTVRVRYEDSLGEAFAVQGSRAYLPWAWTTGICGAYAVGGIVWLSVSLVRWRRRRLPRQDSASAGWSPNQLPI